MEIAGLLIAGMGMFFVGMHMLTDALKQMTSRHLQAWLAKCTGNPVLGGAIGFLAGGIVQSMSALSFIVASLVSVGMIRTRQALPVILWANAGAGLLVLFAVLDIKIVILFVLGFAGVSYAFDFPRRFRNATYAFLGIGLLFYGLQMIRAGAAPLAGMPWFESLLVLGSRSFLLSLGAGALLSFLAQSSSAVTILAIALTQSGAFPIENTVMIIYGSNLGSSIATWVLSSRLAGTPRQLVMAQSFFNFVALFILLPLFYLEVYGRIPLAMAFTSWLGNTYEQQMAWAYIVYNVTGALALSVFLVPYLSLLERLWPATREEEWSRPKYLHSQAAAHPEVAQAVIREEQSRLAELLLRYPEILRTETGESAAGLSGVHRAFQTLGREIDLFASDVQHSASPLFEWAENLYRIRSLQELLRGLDQSIFDLGSALLEWRDSEAGSRFRHPIVEGMDLMLSVTADAVRRRTAEDIQVLRGICGDRSGVLQQLRRTYLLDEAAIPNEDRMRFLEITGIFERTVWNLARIPRCLCEPSEPEGGRSRSVREVGMPPDCERKAVPIH